MAELIKPDGRYKASYLGAMDEFEAEGVEWPPYIRADFEAYLELLAERSKGINLPEGHVPDTHFWLVDDGEYIGRICMRERLTEGLAQVGGHIGYEVRPTKRRRGYGKRMLELALPHAARLGIERALITCDETNIGSRKIIESNGGVLENRIVVQGSDVMKLRFWIDLKRIG